jgi:maltose O-acetyltransferase
VQLLTATHPVDPGARRQGWEYAEPIALADNVWLGGGVIVGPGVTIGQDTVVGAGAVVTRHLPAGVVAAGVPARVRREIGEEDRVEVASRSP